MQNLKKVVAIFSVWVGAFLFILSGCSSQPGVKQQKYAKLKNEITYEYEFPKVWKGIEAAVREYSIAERDPRDVNELELRKLKERSLQTNWIFGRSRDKYIEYKVNGFPRKQYLQTRLKYEITAASIIGGTKVTIQTTEEIERLNQDGSPAGYDSADEVDSSRPNELLEKIKTAILAAAD